MNRTQKQRELSQDTIIDDVAVRPFTTEKRHALYDIRTPYPELRPLIDDYLHSFGNDGRGGDRDWHDSNSADFFEGYAAAGYDMASAQVLQRLADLMRNHFLRDEDYTTFREWLEPPVNFSNPMYQTMLDAYKNRSDDFTFDPRKERPPSPIRNGMAADGGQVIPNYPFDETAAESDINDRARAIAIQALKRIAAL